jgi:hypothetical protein
MKKKKKVEKSQPPINYSNFQPPIIISFQLGLHFQLFFPTANRFRKLSQPIWKVCTSVDHASANYPSLSGKSARASTMLPQTIPAYLESLYERRPCFRKLSQPIWKVCTSVSVYISISSVLPYNNITLILL